MEPPQAGEEVSLNNATLQAIIEGVAAKVQQSTQQRQEDLDTAGTAAAADASHPRTDGKDYN